MRQITMDKAKYEQLKKQLEELPYNPLPQEVYHVLNTQFGMCGFGWKYRIVERFESKMPGKIMLFVRIDLYLKCNRQWSEAIPSVGGVVVGDKPDLINNAIDIAICKALKMLCMSDAMDKKTILRNIASNAKKVNFKPAEIKKIIHEKYGVDSSGKLSIEQAVELNNHFYDILLDSMKAEHASIIASKA